ncbi:hypothetical protein TNCV_1037701 [Trichonephila clavipes]|nr:hypothetical protein TNCV_1037701 [Trichonephila clavipes]
MPHSSHSASFKDMKVCAAIQRDACPAINPSTALMDIGVQVVNPWFFPCERTVTITGLAEQRLISEEKISALSSTDSLVRTRVVNNSSFFKQPSYKKMFNKG